MRLAQRGDYSTDRLNSIKAKIVCAETQAELLHEILAELSEEEASVVRRARNQTMKSNGRKNFDVKTYRQATAFEALVAYWLYKDAQGKQRFEQLIGPYLEKYIDRALGNGKTAFVNNV